MRRGFRQALFYGKHKRFIGLALGSDATTEHEIGIEPLRAALGVNPKAAPGIERRREKPADPAGLRLLEVDETTYLLFLPPHRGAALTDAELLQRLPYLELTPYTGETVGFVGAWDEASFGVAARGAVRAHARELHAALLAGDAALGGWPGCPFEGSGLRLFIISRLPYHLPTTREEANAFTPHEWVLEAMRRAYSLGRSNGHREAKQKIRNALGL